MFRSLIISGMQPKQKKPGTMLVSIGAHSILLIGLLVSPLMSYSGLPTQLLTAMFMVSPPPSPSTPPPPESKEKAPPAPVQPHTVVDPGVMTEPTAIPKDIVIHDGPPPAFVPGNPNKKIDIGVLFGNPDDNSEVAQPLPPPPPPPPPPQRIRQGGNVSQASLISQTKPAYPPLAKQARIQGIVILEAVIGKDGTVNEIRVLNGHPLLQQSAIDAVSQWKYKPTLLNGEPVEVVTTVTVNFAFSQ